MNSKRLHLILLGCLGLMLIGLVGGAYGVNNLLTSKASQLTSTKAKSMALSQEQLSISKAKKDIQQYASLQKITQSVVPEDKSQAEAVREIVNIAASNNVSLSSISFPTSTLGAGVGTTTTGTSAPAAAAPSAAGGGTKTKALSQLTPVKNISGVYNLPITVQSDTTQPVAYNKFINFLSGLEHNRRTAQVSAISLTPDKKNPNLLTFTLTLNEYIKP